MFYIILYYTEVGPGGRTAPRCREVWGAATLPRGRSEGQRPQGNLGFFKPDVYINMAWAALGTGPTPQN